jgi:hypothetical protein
MCRRFRVVSSISGLGAPPLFDARSKRQKVQFGDVEIIVANIEIGNDNC